jgi:methylglutaconyl-CoA hydratase
MNLILYEVKERIGYITLNRPEKRNALSFEMVSELKESFSKAENDNEVKVIILKANGDSFCAGADLAYLQKLQQFSYEENLDDSRHLKELFHQIYTLKKVVIAQVQGHALAGGCGLVTVCDFAFAAPHVKLGYTEVKIGFIPAIVLIFLIRKIGEQKAKHLLLSGDLITAEIGERWNLINQVVAQDQLQNSVFDLANRLVKTNSAKSMELTKQMVSSVPSLSLGDALEYAARMNAEARATEDCKKGINAFLSKQELKW